MKWVNIMIRNFINVVGITDESELPTECPGQFIEYSETDYLFIPENATAINTIYEISLSIEVLNSRTINMKNSRVYILDGNKKFKITCSSKDKNNKSITLKFNYPFNAFIDIDNTDTVKSAKVFVLDAYFHLINPRTIYSNITYLISVEYSDVPKNNVSHIDSKTVPNTDYENSSNANTQKLIINDSTVEIEDNEFDNSNINIDTLYSSTNNINTLNPGLAEQSLTKEDFNLFIQDIDLSEEYL